MTKTTRKAFAIIPGNKAAERAYAYMLSLLEQEIDAEMTHEMGQRGQASCWWVATV